MKLFPTIILTFLAPLGVLQAEEPPLPGGEVVPRAQPLGEEQSEEEPTAWNAFHGNTSLLRPSAVIRPSTAKAAGRIETKAFPNTIVRQQGDSSVPEDESMSVDDILANEKLLLSAILKPATAPAPSPPVLRRLILLSPVVEMSEVPPADPTSSATNDFTVLEMGVGLKPEVKDLAGAFLGMELTSENIQELPTRLLQTFKDSGMKVKGLVIIAKKMESGELILRIIP